MKKNNVNEKKVIDHILNFDPEDPTTALPSSTPQPELLAPRNLPNIPWPTGKAPVPQPLRTKPKKDAPLPEADILIVTWTVAEALALSDVLTPGYRSKTAWYEYAHNWAQFKPLFAKDAPALEEGCLALWFPVKIGNKKVICAKSQLHFARDGAKMPMEKFWLQVIAEVKPSLVITTGTAGGIGGSETLGDVVISQKVRFDCQRTFKNAPFAKEQYICNKPVSLNNVKLANEKLLPVTKPQLPASKENAIIFAKPLAKKYKIDVVTTDFFAFDDTTNHFGLQSLGSMVEMGDAVLGLACSTLGDNSPMWVAVRNASDPQINGKLPYEQQVEVAGRIYEKYGYWTTVNSAIACWALIS